MALPFRWNISRREQLGGLITGLPAESYPGFIDDLRRCSSRLIAFAGDSDLMFIGRSPESIFDYLSGLLASTSWSERPELVNLSIRHADMEKVYGGASGALEAIREQFSDAGLSPRGIIASRRPIALIDLVATGQTIGRVVELIVRWGEETGEDVAGMLRKIRVVGITGQEKTSPKTWRWQQHEEWVGQFKVRSIKNVSIPWILWSYLGNTQKKVTMWNPPQRWGSDLLAQPPREPYYLEALRLALQLYDFGASRGERFEFAGQLAEEKEMRERWLRTLVTELRVA